MAYHTQADLESRYTAERIAELYSVQAPDGSTTGVADATALAATIADVDAEIDSILGGVFTIPLAPVDPVLVGIACDLNPWTAIKRRPAMLADARNRPYLDRYTDAIAKLKEIRNGERVISATKAGANVGGEVANDQPITETFYFIRDRATGAGGLGGY